ncbi:MAG: YraN family protein [Flavobacteriales bacterium]|nr:YraN family protein [Flavobacteriales bacterium]
MTPTRKNTKTTGNKGEQIAVNYLEQQGYVIRCRNYRYGKAEIDIIAQTENRIVFLEVKTRSQYQEESLRDLLSIAQQKRIIEAAHHYIIAHDIDEEARFDLIIIPLNNSDKITHIKTAFYPSL